MEDVNGVLEAAEMDALASEARYATVDLLLDNGFRMINQLWDTDEAVCHLWEGVAGGRAIVTTSKLGDALTVAFTRHTGVVQKFSGKATSVYTRLHDILAIKD